MRSLRFLLQKEFRQILRNKSLLVLMFLMPIIQLLVLPLAADYEVKNIHLTVVDHDHSSYSQKLVSKIIASGYFQLTGYRSSFKTAFEDVETDKADLILEIPNGFERNLVRESQQTLFISINAINGVKATLGGSYLNRIIGDYNNGIRLEWMPMTVFNSVSVIDITQSDWFNPLSCLYGSRYFGVIGHNDRGLFVCTEYREGKRSGNYRTNQRHSNKEISVSSWEINSFLGYRNPRIYDWFIWYCLSNIRDCFCR